MRLALCVAVVIVSGLSLDFIISDFCTFAALSFGHYVLQ